MISYFFQFFGFGAQVLNSSEGRRAATQQASHQNDLSAEQENQEKDQALKQVQARDLIDFGMIPVRTSNTFSYVFII